MATLPLRGKSLGNPDDAAARAIARGGKNPDHIRRYARSLWNACDRLGIRADVAFGQADLETGNRSTGVGFQSDRWVNEGNPAGISIITGMPDGTPGPVKTPEEWGIIHATHLGGYAGITPPDEWKEMDIRWDAMILAGYFGVAETVDDLDQRWTWDPRGPQDYGGKIEARWRLYDFPAMTTTPDPQPGDNGGNDMAELNFDPKLVPMPPHRFKLATNKREGVGMNRFGPRVHRGIVFHRALSNNQSLDTAVGWLLRSDVQGLTDGFIDHRTGEMVIINPMKVMFPNNVPSNWQDMAGWAQGPYSATASWPDGRAFRNKYGGRLGANIINQDLESMEVTGNYETAISEACKATLTQWAASRAQYHKIPWDKFPIIPSTGLTMIYGHREFCGDGHKVCPGKTVWDFINGEMIDRVRAVLKKAQTSGATTPAPKPDPQQPSDPWPYAEAHIPEFITNPGAKPYLEDGNGTTLFWTDKQYVAVRPTKRLKYAYDGAPEVGPIIPAGMDFNVAFVFTAHNGKKYGLTPYGTRVLLDDLKVVSDGPLVGDVIDAVKDTLENN